MVTIKRKEKGSKKKSTKTEVDDVDDKELQKGLLEILKNKDNYADDDSEDDDKVTAKGMKIHNAQNHDENKPKITKFAKGNQQYRSQNAATEQQTKHNTDAQKKRKDDAVDGGEESASQRNKRDNEISPENVGQFESIRNKVNKTYTDNEKQQPEYKFYQMFANWFDGNYRNDVAKTRPAAGVLEQQKAHAEQCYAKVFDEFSRWQKKHPSSDSKWLGKVSKVGTTADKIAALTLMVQEAPFFGLEHLEAILQMCKKKHSSAFTVMQHTKEIFENMLPERRLVHFNDRPLTDSVDDTTLTFWIYEDKLKRLYLDFVLTLQNGTRHSVPELKVKATKFVSSLLTSKPEQEKLLLTIIVNKLGDSNNLVASTAAYLLASLTQEHPNMRLYIVKEVEVQILQQSADMQIKHYGTSFLTQIILSQDDAELAQRMTNIYFSLFKELIGKNEVEAKLLDLILAGVHRAFPFAKFEDALYNEHLNSLFKIVHVTTFNKSLQALQVLYHVLSIRFSIADRYYRALYEKMLSTALRTSTKQLQFVNLLFRSMKLDTSLVRVKAFLKRLLQISLYMEPGFICAALFLVSQMVELRPNLKSLIRDSESAQPSKDDEQKGTYDLFKREPQFANADSTCFWELVILSKHYHPGVRKFVTSLFQNKSISCPSDPIEDMALIAFLDRFSFKNPKKPTEKGISAMQPKFVRKSLVAEPVSSTKFISKSEDEVPEEELFFYKFFKQKQVEQQKKQLQKPKKDEDEEDEFDELESDLDDEEDEDMLNGDVQAMMRRVAEAESDDEEEEEEDATGEEESDLYASAEDYAQLLDKTLSEGEYKQLNWEMKNSQSNKRKGSSHDPKSAFKRAKKK